MKRDFHLLRRHATGHRPALQPTLRHVLAGLTLLVAAAASSTLAGYKETITVDGDSLTLNNLIGEVRLVSGRGGDFEITIDVQGGDAERGALDIDQAGDEITLIFPRASEYVYPRMGRGSQSTFSTGKGNSGWMRLLGEVLGRDRIRVRGSGRGTEIWADVTIRVPDGAEVEINNGVGEVFAEGLDAEVSIDTQSGAVEVVGVRGDLLVDTGSGSVSVEDVEGDVSIDTGSGAVQVADVIARDFVVDTGSGRVIARNIESDGFEIDTGSGSVRAAEIRAESATIDTGSGGVTLELLDMGDGDFVIDTGSGGVELILPMNASASVYADTGSGGIQVDVPGVRLPRDKRNRDEIRFTIGGGDASIEIDTGSGGIKISQR